MSCVCTFSFSILINGSASPFFQLGRGLRKGFPLNPLLFLFIVEGLGRIIHHARCHGNYKGIHITRRIFISHLFCVGNDILIFLNASRREVLLIQGFLDIFSSATSMVININKSSISILNIIMEERDSICEQLLYPLMNIDNGLD